MPTSHPTLLPRSRAALSVVVLALLLTLSPALGPAPAALAAPACPADRSNLMPVRGGRWYLSGVNVPWQSGGFGADFATVEEWGQHTYSSAATERLFAELNAAGVNSVRWWIFGDGRGAPEFDSASGGAVTGLDATTLPGVADVARLAQKYDLQVLFGMFTFEMLMPDSSPSGKGEHAGGHRDLIVDPARRRSYIDNAVIPLLRYPVPGGPYTLGTHPNVLGWEVINEPEWAIVEAEAVDPNIREPVRLAEMQRFVAEVTGAIHRNSTQLVTVGSAAMKWSSDRVNGAYGNYWRDAALAPYDPQGKLDFYQIHYYGWMNGDANWSYSPLRRDWAAAGFDKPTVIGEFPANARDTGASLDGLLAGMYASCYGGAWAWTYSGVDEFGSWSDVGAPMARFNAANSAAVKIGPAAPAPAAGAVIFGDSLAPGWANWSWGAQVELAAASPVQSGSRSAAVTYTSAWGGLYLHTDASLPTAGFGRLRLWVHGGAAGGQRIRLSLRDAAGAGGPEVQLPAPEANRWVAVEVPLAQLGGPAAISGVIIQEAGGAPRPTLYVDEIALVP